MNIPIFQNVSKNMFYINKTFDLTDYAIRYHIYFPVTNFYFIANFFSYLSHANLREYYGLTPDEKEYILYQQNS